MKHDSHRIALVAGANQGLGLALVEHLCRTLGKDGIVYLTARDPARGEQAAATLREQGLAPRLVQLDVQDAASVERLATRVREEHGGVDIVFSNFTRRMDPDVPLPAQVRDFVTTNNLGTTRMIEHFGPLVRDGGRLFIVASGFGRLRHLVEPLHARFDQAASLQAIDDVMLAYVDAVERGTAAAEGWPEWINIPSKVGQVATMRVYARQMREAAERRGIVIGAVCPGLIDTASSRPWFKDMSKAQTPAAAAVDVVWLATAPRSEVPYGELVQHRTILSWDA